LNRLVVAPLALLVLAAPLPAQDQASPPPAPPAANAPVVPPEKRPAGPPIVPLGEGRFQIGSLIADREVGEVRVPGAIAIERGTLEYLICAPGGKLYESLLRADVDPYHLHLALLLIGLQPSNNLNYQGDPTAPEGDPVTIRVEWDEDGERRVHRAEELVWELAHEKTMTPTHWVFTGSVFGRGMFAATVTKSLVAVYADPTAILNNPLSTRGNDTAYTAHEDALPPRGTQVEIVLAAGKPAEGS
jgi:hypothetical protein